MNKKEEPAAIEVGVVGLGLMGTSIIVALLLADHKVKAIAPVPGDLELAGARITAQLEHCGSSGLLKRSIASYMLQLEISGDYRQLKNCALVFECVIEDMHIKASVYRKIAGAIPKDTVVATNTSAIPISMLQQFMPYPGRFIGIHWAEPAYVTRFMEITCGAETSPHYAAWVFHIAHHWGKEPTLLKKDIRGFITNRLMYAVYREAFCLMEKGMATMEDVDKAFRYDAGSWITLMGLFRRMDFTGLEDWLATFETVFPALCNSDKVPAVMQEAVDGNLRGTQNLKGLYNYTEEEAKEWERAFAAFNRDIYRLAALYPWPKLRTKKETIS